MKCGRVRADRKGARRSERRPFTSPRLLRSFSYHPPSRGPISSNRPPRLDLYYVGLRTKDLRIVYGTHDTHGLVLYGFSDSDWGAASFP